MFQLFKKGRCKVGGLLLGIQIFLVFFVPVNIAHAASLSEVWDAITSLPGAIGGAIMTGAGKVVMEVLIFLASLIFQLVGLFFTSMAYVLDIAIASTISTVPYKISTIDIAWTAVRDLSNMFFIFVLLFIAIQTVLGLAGGSAKRWLSHVIIAALLINFSLFLTGVVIDAGNILAMGFWNKMTTTQAGATGPSASMQLMQGLQLQTIGDPKDASGKPIEQSQQVQLFAYLGGTLVMLVAGYVFLAGAVMMIIRTVTLMILMIVSPFAFLGFALPKGGGFANQWLSKLIGSTFVAPAFLAMLYIDSLIINSTDLNSMTGADASKFGAAFAGTPSALPIIYHYILVIILILASLTIANAVSSGAGSAGGAWAKKMIGGGAAMGFAGGAMLGRQTFGSAAQNRLDNKDWVAKQNQLVAKAGMKDATYLDKMKARAANAQLATLQKTAKGSFDIRNAPMGGLGVTAALGKTGINTGTGSKKSFATHGEALSSVTGRYRGTEKEKELIATAKARFPNDPAAQKAYLEQNGVQLESGDGRNKEVKETLNKEISKEQNKKAAETANKKYKELETNLKTATGANVQKIQDEMLGAAKDLRQSMQRMTGEDVSKMMEKEEYRNSKAVQEGLSSKDYTAINKRYMEGGYQGVQWSDKEKQEGKNDTVMMATLTTAALASDQVPENTKRAIKNQMKNGTWGHDIDFKKEVSNIVSSGQDAKGNYIAKTTLTDAEKVKLKEVRSMMDHEDIASLDDSLLLNQHIAKDYSAKTLAAINKKQLETGGESNTAFTAELRDTVLKHNKNERTINQIMTSTGKKESIFYDEDLANKYKEAGDLAKEHSAREKELKAAQKLGPLNQADAAELDKYTR